MGKAHPQYWTSKQLALIAADFGHLDALKAIIELNNDKSRYFQRLAYYKFYSLTEHKYSYIQQKKWFNDNKNSLAFDKATKRYIIKK